MCDACDLCRFRALLPATPRVFSTEGPRAMVFQTRCAKRVRVFLKNKRTAQCPARGPALPSAGLGSAQARPSHPSLQRQVYP